MIEVKNIYGRLYLTPEEIRRFEMRVSRGEFSRKIVPPAPPQGGKRRAGISENSNLAIITIVRTGLTSGRKKLEGATIELRRTGGDLGRRLTIHLSYTGSALMGSDYCSLPLRVTFAPGATGTALQIRTLPGAVPSTVRVGVIRGPGYTMISNATHVTVQLLAA